MSAKKFDPTGFARSSLSTSMRDPLDPITIPTRDEPAASDGEELGERLAAPTTEGKRARPPAGRTRPAIQPSRLVRARAAAGAPKKQLNMRLDQAVYDRAIDAAATVAGHYTLGDIFTLIIDDFEAAADRLAREIASR